MGTADSELRNVISAILRNRLLSLLYNSNNSNKSTHII